MVIVLAYPSRVPSTSGLRVGLLTLLLSCSSRQPALSTRHRTGLHLPNNSITLQVIRTFRCADTERLFHREAVRRFKSMERQALRKLDMLDAAPDLRTLSLLPGNRLDRLKGDREGQYSIRINDQWRLCFTWRDGNAYEVEIVNSH